MIENPFDGNFSNCFKNDAPLICRDLRDNEDLKYTVMFALVWTSFVIIMGTVGNLLVLFIVIHQRTLPKVFRHISATGSTVLLINLAIADLTYCIACLPYVCHVYFKILEKEVVMLIIRKKAVYAEMNKLRILFPHLLYEYHYTIKTYTYSIL